MENQKYQVALLWIKDEPVTYSIHSIDKIQVPRKEAWLYQPGEQVQARWGKKLHVAEVVAVERLEDKAKLEALGVKALLLFQKKKKDLSSDQADDCTVVETPKKAPANPSNTARSEIADLAQGVDEQPATNSGIRTARVDIGAKRSMATEIKSPKKAKTLEVIDVTDLGKTEEVRSSGCTNHGGFCGKCKEICRCKDISRLKERVKELENFKKTVTEEMRKMKEDMLMMRVSLPSSTMGPLPASPSSRNTIGSPPAPPSSSSPMRPPLAPPSSPTMTSTNASSPLSLGQSRFLSATASSQSDEAPSMESLLASVAHLDSTKMQQTVKVLAYQIFTVDELLSCSLSGKKSPHSKEISRPPLDYPKVELFKLCMQRHLPSMAWKDVREKFQNLQKQERMKLKK